MKRIFLLLFLVAAATREPLTAPTPEVKARMDRIENGLLPAVVIKGQQPRLMRLSERMQQLHVPGISVAVIHNGKIEWARGFGLTRIDGPPVTAETLFQAGSISKPVAATGVNPTTRTRRRALTGEGRSRRRRSRRRRPAGR